MDDVRGLFLGMPHGTTPAAVTTNKNIIMSSLNEIFAFYLNFYWKYSMFTICWIRGIENDHKGEEVFILKETRTQWTCTGAIKRQIPSSKPKLEITKITNRQNTMRTND